MIEEYQHTWEGADLFFYVDGESYSFSLSDIEFACVAKILGFKMDLGSGEITTFSDETLKKLMSMEGNPFKLIPIV